MMNLYDGLGMHPYFYNIFPSMVYPRPNHTCVCFSNGVLYAEIFIPNTPKEKVDWFYRPYRGAIGFWLSEGKNLSQAPQWLQTLFLDLIDKIEKMYRLQRLFI